MPEIQPLINKEPEGAKLLDTGAGHTGSENQNFRKTMDHKGPRTILKQYEGSILSKNEKFDFNWRIPEFCKDIQKLLETR